MSKSLGYFICFTQKVFEVFQKLVFGVVAGSPKPFTDQYLLRSHSPWRSSEERLASQQAVAAVVRGYVKLRNKYPLGVLNLRCYDCA